MKVEEPKGNMDFIREEDEESVSLSLYVPRNKLEHMKAADIGTRGDNRDGQDPGIEKGNSQARDPRIFDRRMDGTQDSG